LLSMNMSPFALAMLLETLGFFLKTQSLSWLARSLFHWLRANQIISLPCIKTL
jgi:hypothetical protein